MDRAEALQALQRGSASHKTFDGLALPSAAFRSWITGSSFVACDLRQATLDGSHLRRCDFRQADLRGASLRHVHLSGCDLREADLRGADLTGADLDFGSHPALFPTNLTGANLTGATIKDVNLDGVVGWPFAGGSPCQRTGA